MMSLVTVTENAPDLDLVEFRNYKLMPGTRNQFLSYFERYFLAQPLRYGLLQLAQLLPVDQPDRFVWMRGFPPGRPRKELLTDWYEGAPEWQSTRKTANSFIRAYDNVHLVEIDDSGPPLACDTSAWSSRIFRKEHCGTIW
jgi:hypothetical protein